MAATELRHLRVEVRNRVGILELNRPEKLNALNYDLAAELPDAVGRLVDDPEVGAILFCGAGRAFCAGADLKDDRVHDGADILEFFAAADSKMMEVIASCPKPVVTAIQGYCVGGGVEFLLAADVAVAATDATFFFTQVGLGIFPAGGGTSRLVHRVGDQWAARLVLAGERIDAHRAEQIGLVTEVVAPEALRERAFALTRQIAEQPQTALQVAKQSLLGVREMPLSQALAMDRWRVLPLFAATAHGAEATDPPQ
jgi:enoyl-CoA hydratase